jgi:hypothetical protein
LAATGAGLWQISQRLKAAGFSKVQAGQTQVIIPISSSSCFYSYSCSIFSMTSSYTSSLMSQPSTRRKQLLPTTWMSKDGHRIFPLFSWMIYRILRRMV